MSIESVMPSSHLILCRPLLLLPPIPPSIRVFSSESTLHMRWRRYWSFSFNISPSNEHPGLISFRMDWLDILAVQGTLKSLLQHHSSKASILRCSAFFTIQLSHLPPHLISYYKLLEFQWSLCDEWPPANLIPSVGAPDRLPPKMPQWHIGYSGLKLLRKWPVQEGHPFVPP